MFSQAGPLSTRSRMTDRLLLHIFFSTAWGPIICTLLLKFYCLAVGSNLAYLNLVKAKQGKILPFLDNMYHMEYLLSTLVTGQLFSELASLVGLQIVSRVAELQTMCARSTNP